MIIFSKRVDDFSNEECRVRVSTSFTSLLIAMTTPIEKLKQKGFYEGVNGVVAFTVIG